MIPNSMITPPGQNHTKTSIQYPSPFFDLSKFYMPPNIKEMFKWCRYYYKTDKLIHPVVFKMAEYPVTDLVFEPQNKDVNTQETKRLEELMRDGLSIKSNLIEIGLDYFTYGNAFVTIYFPFVRFLVCPSCKAENQMEDFKSFGDKKSDLDFRNFGFIGKCPSCQKDAMKFEVKDVPIKQVERINIVRLSPEQIDIEHSSITGVSQYFFSVPNKDKRSIINKNFEALKSTPWMFIQAIKEKKKVKMNNSNFYHFRRSDISDGDDGWGMPLVLPVLRDLFYMNVLRKAQEAVAHEHLVPLRVLYPADNQSNAAPHMVTGLGQWKQRVEAEVKKWKKDPNYIPIMPVPLGYQRIGGEGKVLMLTQEIRQLQESIISGMTVPQEFVFGGLSWSGSSISLRMLENHFLVYRQSLLGFLDFLSTKVSSFLDTQKVRIRMQEFKMADDIQRKQLFQTLNQMRKISDSTMLKEIAGMDASAEAKQITADLIHRYETDRLFARQDGLSQSKVQGLMIEEQAEAQRKAMRIQQRGDHESPPGDSSGKWSDLAHMMIREEEQQNAEDDVQQQQGGANVAMDPQATAAHYAEQLLEYPPEVQSQILERMRSEMPEVAQMVEAQLQSLNTSPPGENTGQQPLQQDMEPLPEQRPPQRGPDRGVV